MQIKRVVKFFSQNIIDFALPFLLCQILNHLVINTIKNNILHLYFFHGKAIMTYESNLIWQTDNVRCSNLVHVMKLYISEMFLRE